MPNKPGMDSIDISKLIEKYGNNIKFSAGIKPTITLEIGSNNERKILNDVKNFCKDLISL